MRRINRFGITCALVLGIAFLLLSVRVAWGTTPPGSASLNEDTPVRLTSLKRLIRRFDFEEASQRLVEFPDDFYRRSAQDGASAQGFPPFGGMKLSTEAAYSGKWSFQFDLDGGSLSARTFDGVLPILPFADYMVTVRVRTAGLQNARARLVAWLSDHTGRMIPASRVESELIQTHEVWEQISIELPGEYENAADLVIELQELQPDQFVATDASRNQPVFNDFSGKVWFDDIKVLHLPRVELVSVQPNNITRLPDRPELSILIRDPASEPLITNLWVFDLDGNLIYNEQVGPKRGQHRKIVSLPITTCGWYRAILEVHSKDKLTSRNWLDFVVVPEKRRSSIVKQNRFSVVLPELSARRLVETPELVRNLAVRGIVLPIWSRALSKTGKTERLEALNQTIARLLESNIDITFSLNQIPDEISQALGLDPNQVLEMFNEDPAIWRSHLEELLASFGLEVSRWQVGAIGNTTYLNMNNLGKMIDTAEEVLGRFVANPTIFIPWSVEYTLPMDQRVNSIHTTIPYNIQAASLTDYISQWRENDTRINATFDPLLDERFSYKQQLTDLTLRTLYGWRIGIDEMSIMAPWTWNARQHNRLLIKPAFSVWRTLADLLNGRTFGGEFNTKEGIHCWILKGEISDDSALVVWTDQLNPESSSPLKLFLGARNVQLIDAFGNVEDVALENGFHTVFPSEMPVFIENININLAQFRSAFAITSDFIPAINRVHNHELILQNPWNSVITGVITLKDTADLDISPRILPFTVRAGGTASIPIHIVVGRNVLAGRKVIKAEASLNADRDYKLQLQTTVEVGLPDIEFSATWGQAINVQTGENNLVITHIVTNTGQRILHLDVFVMAPNISIKRRKLPPLGPGERAVRMFNLGRSGAFTSTRQIRVGVEERNGSIRLSRLIGIPVSEDASPQLGFVPN